MNHLPSEILVSLVYNELTPSQAHDAEGHLRTCPQCQQSVERLQTTLTSLDQDKASLVLPSRRQNVPQWGAAGRWALAASVVLFAGFLLGRINGSSATAVQTEVAAAREELRKQFREELTAATATTISSAAEENRRLLAELAMQLQTARAADQRDVLAALEAFDQRRALDTEALRAGLIALARRTGNGFQQTESQLSLLAAYLPAETTLPSPGNSSSETSVKQP